MMQEVTKELAESFRLAEPSGALVTLVQKGGSAEKAGLKTKDIIINFDGKVVNTLNDLPRIVGATKLGTKVLIHVWRNGSAKKMMVYVDEFLSDDEKIANLERKRSNKFDIFNRIGLALKELSDNEKKQLENDNGLLVEDMQHCTASFSGMQLGDIILGINNQDVTTVGKFNQIKEGRNIALLVRRGIQLPLLA